MTKTKTLCLIATMAALIALIAAGWALGACGTASGGVASAPSTRTATGAEQTTQPDATSQSVVTVDTGTSGTSSAVASSTTAQTPGSTGGQSVSTATTYYSSTASISVTKVTTGSGKNTVTYFVGDVQLADATALQSAFAQGGFESRKVDYTSQIAVDNGAVFAVNGDYCIARSTGIIIRNGVTYQDNPAREGLAIYKDGTMKVYDETATSAEQLVSDGVWNTFSFGPAVLVDGNVPGGVDTTEVYDIGEQHTIFGSQPRTAVGIIDKNHFVFVVVDGRSTGYSRGVSLSELGQIFKDLGCTTAYNLDGGGSSAMYFQGQLVNDPLGEGRERGISDILMVTE